MEGGPFYSAQYNDMSTKGLFKLKVFSKTLYVIVLSLF